MASIIFAIADTYREYLKYDIKAIYIVEAISTDFATLYINTYKIFHKYFININRVLKTESFLFFFHSGVYRVSYNCSCMTFTIDYFVHYGCSKSLPKSISGT